MAAEKRFENRLKRWLETNGIYPLGTPSQKVTAIPIGYFEKRWGGGQFTKSGLPDMHIVVNGHSLDAELKAPNGRPSELQLFVIEQINACGGNAMLVYPTENDVEKFKAWLERNYPKYNVPTLDEKEFKKIIQTRR